MKQYHTLLIKYDNQWFIEFGDYDRESVEEEAEEYRGEQKIITTSENQKEIDSVVNSMNTELAKKGK